MKYFLLFTLLIPLQVFSQSSMRRCTLLPITDSVGGAIGFKVFEQVEQELKKSNWCTYVSNSSLISVFSKYRENLPQYLKQKEVLKTVAEKLKVGSLVRIALTNEIRGVEVQLEIHGEDGEDLYFSEKTLLDSDEIDLISQTARNWLDMYSKMIPYDAKVTGILGDQVTLDVGKGYPIQIGQSFVIKRLVNKKKHPLLNKIVDWDTEILAEGKVFNISDNQALGMVKSYKSSKKLTVGDWVRLREFSPEIGVHKDFDDEKKIEPGKLGILSFSIFASKSSVETVNRPGGTNKMVGNLYGFDFRGEGWITRQYFAALELLKSIGKLGEAPSNAGPSSVSASFSTFKLTGGYRYLPTGFFYGPQVDFYGGYAKYTFDMTYVEQDGLGVASISGILLGATANIPINREYRFFVQADFLPFPKFEDKDGLYGGAKSVSALELELGVRYQFTSRITLDGSFETLAAKAKFDGVHKEISYHDNIRLKLGASLNF